jgi:hypothetical protein
MSTEEKCKPRSHHYQQVAEPSVPYGMFSSTPIVIFCTKCGDMKQLGDTQEVKP